MKPIQKHLTLVIFTIFCSSSFARIGDTNMSSNMRYGRGKKTPISILTNSKTLSYKYKGWTIYQAFVGQTVMRIQYYKGTKKITKAEIEIIFKAEDRFKNWQKMSALNKKYYGINKNTLAWISSSGYIAIMKTPYTIQIDSKKAHYHEQKYKKITEQTPFF